MLASVAGPMPSQSWTGHHRPGASQKRRRCHSKRGQELPHLLFLDMSSNQLAELPQFHPWFCFDCWGCEIMIAMKMK